MGFIVLDLDLVHLDRDGVRYLLAQRAEGLFPYKLAYDKRLRVVRDDAFGERGLVRADTEVETAVGGGQGGAGDV